MNNAAIIPGLRYKDAPVAIEFLYTVFGFQRHLVVEGENGTIVHAQLIRGSNCMIMLGSSRADEYGSHFKMPSELEGFNIQAPYIIIEDIDEHYYQAKKSGVEMIKELTEQEYGGKQYTCKDTEGYLWNFESYNPWAIPGE